MAELPATVPHPPMVVVVEDDEEDAQMALRGIGRLLPVPGVKVIGDGEAALRELLDEEGPVPGLVFLDLKLPKVHGLEVLKSVRALPDRKTLPIVVLSSSDEPRDIQRAQDLGCTAYLTKPLDWTEYVKLVCETAAQFLPQTECNCP